MERSARWIAPLVLACATSVLCLRTAEAQESAPAPLDLQPYTLRGFDGVETPAELGTLTVPADRDDPDGGTIALAFVRLPATSPAPGVPIVFLAGGPGVPGIVMGQVPVYRTLFERLRAIGDVVLLDQRGTGRSTPSLDCPADAPLPTDALLDETKARAALLGPLERCAARLAAAGVDLSDYTTRANADDVEDLRRALGVERVSLLGFSYGSEVALSLIRRHPTSIERVVLAAPRPPWAVVKLPSAYDRAIAALSVLAAADPDAGIADLEGSLRRTLARLSDAPMELTIADERSGAEVVLRAGKVALQTILLSGLPDGRAMPAQLAMVAALDGGEPELFRRQVERLYNGLGRGLGLMGLAMNCSAGIDPERSRRAAAEAETALLGAVPNLLLTPEACRIPHVDDPGPGYRALVESSAPALLLSGSLDPNAPPAQAEEVRAGFRNGIHVVVEHGGHETLPAAEVQSLIADFLAGNDVTGRRVELPPPDIPTLAEALAEAPPR